MIEKPRTPPTAEAGSQDLKVDVSAASAVPLPRAPETRPVWRRFLDAVDERMGIDALRYEVPEHANNLAWSFGGLTAVSFVTLLVSGIYLAQF